MAYYKKIAFLVLFLTAVSCNEKLLEKPENLIDRGKMVVILKDVAVLNAAKTTNVSVLRENNVDIMNYIYRKHGIDSLQFVESDKYYASVPEEYKSIYQEVESSLEKDQNAFKDAKEVRDSLRRIELEERQARVQRTKDSLQEISGSKK